MLQPGTALQEGDTGPATSLAQISAHQSVIAQHGGTGPSATRGTMPSNDPAAIAGLDSTASPYLPFTEPVSQESMPAVLYLRQGTIEDLPTILGFIAEASDWLQQKGTDQWAKPWPNEEERDERVRTGLVDGRTWMAEDAHGTPIATISCKREGNPGLWDKPEYAESAVYVSRLIVRRRYEGQAIGAELLNWAGKRAADRYGARWIRIDVWTTNVALHDYYEKRKFSFLEFCDDSGYPSAALFQRSTRNIRSADFPRLRWKPAGRRLQRTRRIILRGQREQLARLCSDTIFNTRFQRALSSTLRISGISCLYQPIRNRYLSRISEPTESFPGCKPSRDARL
jgi:GNAT superfamily N-acetyltransferase